MTARAVAVLALVALAGCNLGPDFQKPQAALPTAWDNASPALRAAWPASDWWHAFGSPQLDRLMAQARAGNNDLLAAASRIVEADASARVAGAPLLPSLQLGTNVGPTRLLNNSGRERHYTALEGFLQASYELDFWGKNRAALDAAQASASAARYAADVLWLSTSTSVANTYFLCLSLEQRLGIAQDNLLRAQHNVDAANLQLGQGLVPRLAVVQQQALAATVAEAIPPLRQQLTQARTALALLTGQLPEAMRLTPETLTDLRTPPVGAGLPSELLTRRPDVQEAEALLIAANADIRSARAQFFPSFSLTADGGLTSYQLAQGLAGPLGVYSLLQSITQPIFKGGALRGQLDQAKGRYQELLTGTYQKAVLSAFGDVENALAGVQNAHDALAAAETAAQTAQDASGLASTGYQGGTGTVLDVLLSETTVFSARDALAQARLLQLQALVNLTAALGGGWQR